MANESTISTQTAILLGSLIIAGGLFLGLRGKNEPPVSAPPTAPQAPAAQQVPAALAPAIPPPAVPVVDRAAVIKEVEAVLNKQKKTLADTCLAPSLVKKAEPKNIKYTLNFTFDATGKQLTRGTMEDRATSRPDVTECLSRLLPELHVTPTGQNVYVEVPLELP
jgi:hypothetical protein